MSNQTSSITPQAVEPAPQEEGLSCPIPTVEPPGTGPQQSPVVSLDDLTEEERRQYDSFVKGMRGGQTMYVTTWRYKAFTELLGKLEGNDDLGGEWNYHKAMEETLHCLAVVSQPSPKAIKFALQTLIAETRETLDPADELRALEPEVRAVFAHLSAKTKAIIGILKALASLEGLSIDLDFGNKILYEELADHDLITKALAGLAEDPDMQVLGKAYDLANRIEEAESNR
jgi:hypothetical protein